MTDSIFLMAVTCELVDEVSVSASFHGGVVAGILNAFFAAVTAALSVDVLVARADE
ncbi:hypothetical protein WBP06_12850 [Novosphingobium sp. BL-8H]|uniref:hypothetical protein n=1 Tax=Novosphingobium sp. BL-8H TaxID=3127640 RepID=UPI003756A9D9